MSASTIYVMRLSCYRFLVHFHKKRPPICIRPTLKAEEHPTEFLNRIPGELTGKSLANRILRDSMNAGYEVLG